MFKIRILLNDGALGAVNVGVVVAVDVSKEAIDNAKENAKLNGLDNKIEFRCENVFDTLPRLVDEHAKFDFIILDPPRDGVHPKALEKILDRYNCKRILYISCKPTSLVRDLDTLQARGYKPTRVCCVDMFPGTPNTEVLCLLKK